MAPALRDAVHSLSHTLHGYAAARTTALSSCTEQSARLEASALRAFAYHIIERPHSGPGADNYPSTSSVIQVDESVRKTLDSMISNGEIGAALLFYGESFANNTHPSGDVKKNLCQYWALCHQFHTIARSLWDNRLKSTISSDIQRRGIEMFVKVPYVFDNSRWMAMLTDMEAYWPIRDCLGTSVLHVLLQELGRKKSLEGAHESSNFSKRIASHCQRPDQDPMDRSGRSAIHIAAQHNLPDVVQALIDVGINGDRRTRSRRTALHFAAALGHSDVCGVLVQHSKDVNSVDRYARTPLHYACRLGHVEVVRILLRRRDILVNQKDEGGDTPLMAALRSEQLRRPSGQESQDHSFPWEMGSPWRSLALSTQTGSRTSPYKEFVRHLGVDFNLTNGRSETALHIAVLQNNYEAVEELAFRCVASINTKDIDGRTALCCAAQRGLDERIVQILLSVAGVDSGLPDLHGKTPLDYASLPGKNFKIHSLLNARENFADFAGAGVTADAFRENLFRSSLTTTGPFNQSSFHRRSNSSRHIPEYPAMEYPATE